MSMRRIKSARYWIVFGAAVVVAAAATAQEIDFKVTMSTPWLPAEENRVTHMKVALSGFDWQDARERTPANVAIVLDRSGSMEGEKIGYARDAAKIAVNLLDSRDIASVVVYSDTVSVLVPATRVTDRGYIRERIDAIYADGSTALFAGVSKGADEVMSSSTITV